MLNYIYTKYPKKNRERETDSADEA
jgi:hypothetical protein